MPKKYPWLLPSAFGISMIALVTGLVLKAKNASQVRDCTTKLGEAHQLVSSHFRSVCSTAKVMSTTGIGLAVVGGIIAAIVIVIGIVHLATENQRKAAENA
jgi:hypothetical protein